ncbi:hypothetical protein G6M04_19740 [Agrobacterium rhizogenes]|uniref:hypothetical protein n=1 Tax=Rhizobium rhizogenes TaxID=359 RepID=UPI0015747363|nr:hypothetical protein [Rhizobium rhizogenes]NTG49620.1 hypothetical protein [Rhizobium rhizogenes]
MLDSIIIANVIQLRDQYRLGRSSPSEDEFYEEHGHNSYVAFTWFGNILDRTYAWLKTKKADRPNVDRSACDRDACCGQAASAR